MRTVVDRDLLDAAPASVARPFMAHRWSWLSFLHWPCEPAAVQALLPPGVEADVFDGSAWVGLVPFHLTVRLPARAPALPWMARTPEVNTRTYVRGPDGRRGIWFFSLDASRLAAVLAARAWYRIPYRWASMRMSVGGNVARYDCVRRSAPAVFRSAIEIGEPVALRDLSDVERFLICRWRLYSRARDGRVLVSEIDHDPWPLHRARPASLDESLLQASGLSRPDCAPLTHYSPGVDVRWRRRYAV